MGFFSTGYDAAQHAVRLTLTGRLDEALVERAAVAAAALGLERGCRRFLCDTQRIDAPLSPDEMARVATGLGDFGLPERHRIAIVTAPFPAEDQTFASLAARSGYTLRVFTSEQAALDWLESP